MQQDHHGRSYNEPSPPAAARNEMIRKARTSHNMQQYHQHQQHQHAYEDHRMLDNSHSSSSKQQEAYMRVAGRGFRSTGFDIKQGHTRDDEQQTRDERSRNLYGNAGSATHWEGVSRGSHIMATGGEEGRYAEIDGRRGEVSGVSQSEGSDGYGEDGDLEEEEEHEMFGGRESEGDDGDRGEEDIHRAYQPLPDSQMVSLEGRQDPSGTSLRFPANFPAGMADRDRAVKALPNNSLGMFLSTNQLSSTSPFSSPSGVQNGQHSENDGYENGGRELVLREPFSSRDASSQARPGNTVNYYTTLLHLPSGIGTHKVDSGNDSGCSGDRSVPPPDQTLRMILSDHLSGALMDDATIFPCGHSFGNAGLQRVLQTNACIICGITVRPESGAPNYALRAAVHAFRQEQVHWNMDSWKSAKRKRDEQFLQCEHSSMDSGRPKGVQFPYVVNDRVLIKGNKRTPERFVGREAIVTTQCLNGWYVVRTLDNGESVKLQYRSLQKIGEFG